jgi:hypothetical protein
MPRGRWVLAVGALAVAVAVTGAIVVVDATRGSGGPSVPEYLASVEAICVEVNERLDRIPPPGDLSSPGAVVESLKQALPLLREQERDVRALSPPVSLRAALERFFRLTDRSLAELQAALDAALERELFPMATALTRFGEARDQAKLVGREIGFHC